MATLKDLRSWIERDLSRFGKLEDHLHDRGEENDPQIFDHTWRFSIYTDNNEYAIVAIERKLGRSYLGCISKSRKPRAGEDWHRGRDLADGGLSDETWHRILADIVSYEMVRVHGLSEESLRSMMKSERLYPPQATPTRLTTGDGLESRTESASPTAPLSSPRTPRGLDRLAETAGAKRKRSRRARAFPRRVGG